MSDLMSDSSMNVSADVIFSHELIFMSCESRLPRSCGIKPSRLEAFNSLAIDYQLCEDYEKSE